MPPPIHAKANYADVVPPASHANPHMEDWETSSSDASVTADPAPVAKEADKNPVGSMCHGWSFCVQFVRRARLF